MSKLKSEIIILVIFILIAAILVGYNIFSVEMQKKEAQRQLEEEVLEELRSRETIELAEYYQDYKLIKSEFTNKAAWLSGKMGGEFANIGQLKELTTERLNAAKDYREKLNGIDTPKPLETFLAYELEFIESDIETIGIVLSYYGSESYSTYDDSELKKLYMKTDSLLHKAEGELQKVFNQHELEYMLE
ncbi:MAG: hypothetical protein MUP02_01810, partial [Actinobacteria bacterium]|nr:hypothetical protein [Actinomycetota bacterium]